jgi:hypothetical protein
MKMKQFFPVDIVRENAVFPYDFPIDNTFLLKPEIRPDHIFPEKVDPVPVGFQPGDLIHI